MSVNNERGGGVPEDRNHGHAIIWRRWIPGRTDFAYPTIHPFSGVNENITLNSVILSKVVKEDVLLMKVDVEGWEWSVMKGAGEMLRQYNVENIVMEYSPGVDAVHRLNCRWGRMCSHSMVWDSDCVV